MPNKGAGGKDFEAEFKQSCVNQEIFCIRIPDMSITWSHNALNHFGAISTSPCDFLVYNQPNLFAIECKSTQYSSISIQSDPLVNQGMIKLHQINSLVKFGQEPGVYAGFLFNFHDKDDVTKNNTYWLSIQNFSNFLVASGKKSINKVDCVDYGGIIVESKLRRVTHSYNIVKLLEDIRNASSV